MSNLNDPRVLFAAERTLLAWNRTSLALIAFGFLVERAGLLMRLLEPERDLSTGMRIAMLAGLGFILLGVASASYSTLQYGKVLRSLDAAEFPPGYGAKGGMVVNGVVALLGVVLVVVLYLER